VNVEIFTLCDAAADYQGRLSILGVFDTIFAPQLPARHPHCAVALRMTFERTEQGEHSLVLHIVDMDGRFVVPELKGAFGVEIPEGSGRASVNLVLNLGQIQFDKYGEHAINIAVDGHQVGSLPFWVKEPPTRRN
jgi:hypothetical protein